MPEFVYGAGLSNIVPKKSDRKFYEASPDREVANGGLLVADRTTNVNAWRRSTC